MGCRFGKCLRISGNVYFRPNKINSISLGNNVHIIARFLSNTVGLTNPAILECVGDGKIVIGDNSGMSSVIISSRTQIEIGKNVKIGGNSRIFDHDFHSLNYLDRREGGDDFVNVKSLPVCIEDDVFIGTNVLILKGVHIGARTVIAAGSIVAIKKIPPDSFVAGNPAKILVRNSI